MVPRCLHGPSRRRAKSLLVFVALLLPSLCVGASGATAAGLGGSNSFNELTKGQPETTTTQQSSTQAAESSRPSNSRTLLLAGGAAAVVLLCGIALAVVRDARRVAPAGDVQLTEARSRSDAAARVRRRRAQAKAARRQRKRNR